MQVDWEAIKRREREQKGEARSSLMDGVPAGIPALLQAEKLQRKAALVGFDWSNIQEVLAKLDEEVAELKEALSGPESSRNRQAAQDELGDVLFTLVNLARHLDGGHAQSSAEQALRRASHKFSRRFRFMEAVRNGEMDGLSASEWERLWQQAKRNPETTKTS
jgi:ATP diphosphatase